MNTKSMPLDKMNIIDYGWYIKSTLIHVTHDIRVYYYKMEKNIWWNKMNIIDHGW